MGTNDVLISQLLETLKLLQIIHHRNKNQHRHARWWEWLTMLKRCVKKLIQELQSSCRATAHSKRVAFMKDVLIPKCYLPFTQLVHDNQFSPLGLALVGELAKLRGTLNALDAEDTTVDEMTTISAADHHPPASLGSELLMEDVGESLKRKSSNFDLSHNLNLSISRQISVEKDVQPDSNHESDPRAARRPTPQWKSTLAASSDPSRSSGDAKSKSRNFHSHKIDQLFKGLA
ncbi:hypothetical protein MMC07_002663 [Pseudocyphellaria aurata]|nr:hypothetical protein [Pseudocyphellaria aurata]